MSRASKPEPEPLTPAVFHILLALAENARHGYAILQEVERTSGRPAGPGTIYGTLQRLEEAGLVAEAEPPRDQADPRRRYYSATAAGRAALRAEAARLVRMARLVRSRRLAGEAGAP